MPESISRTRLVITMVIGLIAISFASIFIKLCTAPTLVIAAYRLVIASSFYYIYTRIRIGPTWKYFSWSQRRVAVISGVFLTIHFITWIASLKFTSVASSVVLVQSAPVFVAIGSWIVLREKPSPMMIIGIIIALSGSTAISAFDVTPDRRAVTGNLLAVCGAIGAAGYMIAGRHLRTRVDTFRYVTVVYTTSAVLLLILAVMSRSPLTGYNPTNYLLLVAIAVVPQIIGHTMFNWGLKFFSATSISIILLGEPIGASILALFILDENLPAMTVAGGLIIILGVILVLLAESKQNPEKR